MSSIPVVARIGGNGPAVSHGTMWLDGVAVEVPFDSGACDVSVVSETLELDGDVSMDALDRIMHIGSLRSWNIALVNPSRNFWFGGKMWKNLHG